MTKREIEQHSNYLRKRVKARKQAEQLNEELRLRKMIDKDAYYAELVK